MPAVMQSFIKYANILAVKNYLNVTMPDVAAIDTRVSVQSPSESSTHPAAFGGHL